MRKNNKGGGEEGQDPHACTGMHVSAKSAHTSTHVPSKHARLHAFETDSASGSHLSAAELNGADGAQAGRTSCHRQARARAADAAPAPQPPLWVHALGGEAGTCRSPLPLVPASSAAPAQRQRLPGRAPPSRGVRNHPRPHRPPIPQDQPVRPPPLPPWAHVLLGHRDQPAQLPPPPPRPPG